MAGDADVSDAAIEKAIRQIIDLNPTGMPRASGSCNKLDP